MDRFEADKMYNQTIPPGLRLGRDWFGLKSVEFTPWASSPLATDTRQPATTVKLVADYLMCPIVLGRHRWQIEELDFAKKACTGSEPITLVDVGANMGLFSRQLIMAIPAISQVFAYEPEPNNFECLIHNLKPFHDQVVPIQAAVANSTGKMDFYIDPTNSGNFSLAVDAMPPEYTTVTVDVRDVAVESLTWLKAQRRVFYKSDTEGLDEFVMAAIPHDVWSHVFAGMIEVWNINKPDYDQAAFASILDRFPNKVFLANADTHVSEQRVSTADVLNYIHSGNRQHRDLAFSA